MAFGFLKKMVAALSGKKAPEQPRKAEESYRENKEESLWA